MAEPDEVLTRAKAEEIERAGVDTVFLKVGDRTVKVISNGMVDILDYSIVPNLSGAFDAITNPLYTNITNNKIIMVAPINPSSSQTTEKIKSFAGSGRYKNFCRDCPKPNPHSPPEPIANKDCTVW